MSLFSGSTPTQINNDLTRQKIQAQSNKIRLADSDLDTKLDLFCYNHCDNNEPDLVKNCRGIVFSGDDIVFRGFPYTEEFTTEPNSFKEFTDQIDLSDWSRYRFFDAHEGALIRVFYWENKWYISTHRKLDAFRSKWASKLSFGDMFKSAIEQQYNDTDSEFYKYVNNLSSNESSESESVSKNIFWTFINSLDKTKQYMFLVLNNYDNRIVCQAPDNSVVYHVGTTDTKGNMINLTESERIPVEYPHEYTFNSVDEIVNRVNEIDPVNLQGIIIFDYKTNKQYKIFNQDYYDLFQVRGNEPSVKYRYLQIRNNKKLVDSLYYLYPKFADAFDDYENTLCECAKTINKYYIDRFIKKKYITVPKEEYQVMTSCHEWHLQDRTKNRISLRKVSDILNEQPASNLNRIIRRFKNEETKNQMNNQSKTTRLRARSYSHNSDEQWLADRNDSRGKHNYQQRRYGSRNIQLNQNIPENQPSSPTVTTNIIENV